MLPRLRSSSRRTCGWLRRAAAVAAPTGQRLHTRLQFSSLSLATCAHGPADDLGPHRYQHIDLHWPAFPGASKNKHSLYSSRASLGAEPRTSNKKATAGTFSRNYRRQSHFSANTLAPYTKQMYCGHRVCALSSRPIPARTDSIGIGAVDAPQARVAHKRVCRRLRRQRDRMPGASSDRLLGDTAPFIG